MITPYSTCFPGHCTVTPGYYYKVMNRSEKHLEVRTVNLLENVQYWKYIAIKRVISILKRKVFQWEFKYRRFDSMGRLYTRCHIFWNFSNPS